MVAKGVPAVLGDAFALLAAENIDVLVDVTGAVEFGDAGVSLCETALWRALAAAGMAADARVAAVLPPDPDPRHPGYVRRGDPHQGAPSAHPAVVRHRRGGAAGGLRGGCRWIPSLL